MGLKKLAKLLLVCITIIGVTSGVTYAQEDVTKFPSRPINFIVPFSPGSNADLAFRLIGKEAEKYLGQTIVVVNKAGEGYHRFTAVASAKPDGYTVGHSPGQVLFVMSHLESLPYHPIKGLTYIMQPAQIYFAIFVKGNAPFKSFQDLMAWGRNNPTKLTYATNGPLSHGACDNGIRYQEGTCPSNAHPVQRIARDPRGDHG